MTLITGHVFRAFHSSIRPVDAKPGDCAYMNCRRPRSEHEREVSGRYRR